MYCSRKCCNKYSSKIRRGKASPPPKIDPVERLSQAAPEQLAWVAGIIEGEGSISTHRTEKIGNIYTHALIKVSMVDEDIIKRCAEWTGLGRVTGPHLPPSRAKLGHQPHWAWNVNKHEHVEAIVTAMWPLFGERRRMQITAMRQRMSERTLKRAS